MKIRPLRKNEINLVSEIAKNNYQNSDWVSDNITKELRAMFSNCVIKPKYLVAEEKNNIIGFLGYVQSWMDYDSYEIFWVNVKKDYQKKGIGTLLINKVIETIKEKNAHIVLISTCIPDYYSKKFDFKPISSTDEEGYLTMMLDLK